MRNGPDEEEQGAGGRWMLTFNDLVTLLLAFFVLVLSMSMVDQGKLTEATAAARNTFGGAKGSPAAGPRFEPFALPTLDRDIAREKAKKKGSAGAVNGRLPGGLDDERTRMMAALNDLQGIGTKVLPEGLSICLEERLLFSPGSAEIRRKDDPSLAAVIAALRRSDVLIRVEGHAGAAAEEDGAREFGWTLSTARALSGVELLIGEGGISPERLSAAPCLDLRPAIPMPDGGDRIRHRGMVLVLTFQEK
ncbi:MAG TPA: flagellar motor protein MotB [Syntrophales bacterium]|nr:flagellar motor protein MotB [Syntrophales bacterium]